MADALNQLSSSPPDAPRVPVAATPQGPEGAVLKQASEKPPEVLAEERVSPKLQTLYRRERAALDRERAAKAKESEVEMKLQGFAQREARLQEFETLRETNPLKALEMLGLSYQELTQVALADGNVTAEVQVKKVEEKFDSFLKTQEEEKRKAAEDAKLDATRREEQATQEFKSEIHSFLETNAKTYQLIQFEGQQSLVYEVIDEHYNRTVDPKTGIGKIMSISEASDKVEAFLEKKYDSALNLDKIKTKLTPAEPKPLARPQAQSHKPPTTLTNHMSATPQKPRATLLTDDERVAKAIAYARGLRP